MTNIVYIGMKLDLPQIEFEGVSGGGYQGDIALDDLEWNPKCGSKII